MKFDLQCKKHPKYQAKLCPRSTCEACLALYWLKRDGYREMVDGGALQVMNPVTKL